MKYLQAQHLAVLRLIPLLAIMPGFSSLGLGQATLYNENFGTNSGALPTGWTADGLTNIWTNPTAGLNTIHRICRRIRG